MISVISYFLWSTNVSRSAMIESYEANSCKMNGLALYVESISNKNTSVSIEFDNTDRIGIFHIKADSIYESNLDLRINSSKVDSIQNCLGWSKEELNTIRIKIEDMNCVFFSNFHYIKLGYRRKLASC